MNINNKVDKVIEDILEFIITNPLVFCSEVDIQFLITRELMKIPELSSDSLYPTNCSIGLNRLGEPSDRKYVTTAVHREYGSAEINNARSDIVILNPNKIKNIGPIDYKAGLSLKIGKDKADWIKPDYIIEIGTEKSAGEVNKFSNHLRDDIRKTNASNNKGYIIHIQRNIFKDKKNKQDNDEKIEHYLKVINEEKKMAKANIRILVFIIDIGNEGRRVIRKVRAYKNNKFVPMNQNNLNKEIRKILN